MFAELKARQAAAWGAGPFERVEWTAAEVHDDLIVHLSVRPGERWLDVATGAGAIALRAARAGARVVGVDIAPALIETSRRRAASEGLHVQFDVGDAENLPYDEETFDVVASSQGVMFAPDHRAAAREMARVCAPGGRLGLTCWRPGGAVEAFFTMLAGFQPPSPSGAGRPLDWGRKEHVRQLLVEAFELEFIERTASHGGDSGEGLWHLFSTSYGPFRTLVESLDNDRREALHRRYVEYYESYRTLDGLSVPLEYVVVLGRRRER